MKAWWHELHHGPAAKKTSSLQMFSLMPVWLEPIIHSWCGWTQQAEMTLSLGWIGVGNWLIASFKQHCNCN